MARIPEAELERLKSEVSVQRLVEASGAHRYSNETMRYVLYQSPGLKR